MYLRRLSKNNNIRYNTCGDKMKSILNQVKTTQIIQKSKFITYLYPIKNENEIHIILKEIKNLYHNADHICYGYKMENIEGYSDDKEPNKTAGFPILNTVKQEQLDFILCIVIRYFGGIKLGKNGLIKAYASCVKKAVLCATIVHYIKGFLFEISFSYTNIKQVDFLLKDSTICSKNFSDKVLYKCDIKDEDIKIILPKLKSICISINPLESTWIICK